MIDAIYMRYVDEIKMPIKIANRDFKFLINILSPLLTG